MSIHRIEECLSASARTFGDKVALVAGGRRLTFAELETLSDRIATALKDGGIKRGDRVLVFMDNCLGGCRLNLRGAEGRRRLQSGEPVDEAR